MEITEPTNEQYDILKKTMDSIYPILEKSWINFKSIRSILGVKKNTNLTVQAGQELYLYFVLEGVQRIYYLSEEGKECSIIFSYPNSFSGVIDAAFTNTPSSYFFETITDSVLLRAPMDSFNQLIKADLELAQFLNLALSFTIKGLLERLVERQSLKSEEKFKLFMKRSPHLLHLIPQRYLANYLGIDPTNFSKFINNIII